MRGTARTWMRLLAMVLAAALVLAACADDTPETTEVDDTTDDTAADGEAEDAEDDPAEEEDDDGLVEVEDPADEDDASAAEDLSGTVTIALQEDDTQTWEAVAEAYMDLHPDVTVNVELKPTEGYQEFVRAEYAAGTPTASLVNGNVVADLIEAGEFLDLAPYLDRTSPYTGEPWREDMDETAIANMVDPTTGEMYTLNAETVQILWFYNIQAFEEAGILEEAEEVAETETNQPTWDQFMGWCDALSDAGYTPVAIEGDFRSFWELRFGWMARMYLDQFTRDEMETARAQPGDWNFREGIDDEWEYDPTDPGNDDATQVTLNTQREMQQFRDGDLRVDDEKFRALYENFKDFSDRCAPDGWIGTTDAYPLFLTQEAAIRLDAAALLTTFERDIASLAAGEYTPPGEEDAEAIQADASLFDIGSFNNPSMEGPEVDAPARTIEVNIGFYSIPRKEQEQNDLEIDFLMYLTSPEGFGTYLENRLDADNPNGGINGPPIIRDVELPAEYQEAFDQLRLIGNNEKSTAGRFRSRGLADYQPSVREWVDLAQQFFTDEIDLDTFLTEYQASTEAHFDEVLEHLQLEPADVDDPSRRPESQN